MRRRSPIETKINHERWLVSYSDFITLLFAFFVVMYSVSQVSESKYRVLSETLQSAFKKPQTEPVLGTPNVATVQQLESELTEVLQGLLGDGVQSIRGNESWVEIEINANVLFDSASAEPSAEAKRIFSDVADVLAPADNAVAVSGHTDNIPIRNARYTSNWELSSARAVAVVNLLAYGGVRPERLSAIGYGEYQPIAKNTTAEGRAQNRRVVLRVARSQVAAPRAGAEEIVGVAPVLASEPAVADPIEEPSPGTSVTVLQENAVAPIKLPNGGLLFTNDPRGRNEAQ